MDNELRPCMVDVTLNSGFKLGDMLGLFHKWITEEEVILQVDSVIKSNRGRRMIDTILEYYKSDNMTTKPVNVIKVQKVYGLVEFGNGRVKKVKPEDIRFLDTEEKLKEVNGGE